MPTFSGCIACGCVIRGESGRIARVWWRVPRVMALVLAGLTQHAGLPCGGFIASASCPMTCWQRREDLPTQVPFRAIARFVRDKAGAVGGALPLPRASIRCRRSLHQSKPRGTAERGQRARSLRRHTRCSARPRATDPDQIRGDVPITRRHHGGAPRAPGAADEQRAQRIRAPSGRGWSASTWRENTWL